MPLFQATTQDRNDPTKYAGTKLTYADIYAAADRPPIPGTIIPTSPSLSAVLTGNLKSFGNTGIEVFNRGLSIAVGDAGKSLQLPLFMLTSDENAAAQVTGVLALPYGIAGGGGKGNSVSGAVSASGERAAADSSSGMLNNFYRDGVAGVEPIGSPSGIVVVADPKKTTTVLGSYAIDMDNVINQQLGYPKTINFGDKPGGFNVLNVPDKMYKTPDQFWSEVNRPFLDQAINRGDNIVLVTKPTDSALNRTLPDGTVVRSGFGREYDYLQQHGYKYDGASSMMIRR